MEARDFNRDSGKVLGQLKELADGSIVTQADCVIYMPKRFEEVNLAVIAEEISILGIVAICIGSNYGVLSVTAMVTITPAKTNVVKFGDAEYYEFEFAKGDTVLTSTDLIRSGTLPYYIYNEFMAKGRVPWYMSLADMCKIYSTAKTHTNVKVGDNHVIVEMIIATLARNPDNLMEYHRHMAKPSLVPTFIPFRSVTYGASDTTSKLMGSYFDDGLDSALVNPADEVETVEALLRK